MIQQNCMCLDGCVLLLANPGETVWQQACLWTRFSVHISHVIGYYNNGYNGYNNGYNNYYDNNYGGLGGYYQGDS